MPATAEAIRDRVLTLIEALTPTSLAISLASDLPLGANAPIASGLRIQPFKKWPKSSDVCNC